MMTITQADMDVKQESLLKNGFREKEGGHWWR